MEATAWMDSALGVFRIGKGFKQAEWFGHSEVWQNHPTNSSLHLKRLGPDWLCSTESNGGTWERLPLLEWVPHLSMTAAVIASARCFWEAFPIGPGVTSVFSVYPSEGFSPWLNDTLITLRNLSLNYFTNISCWRILVGYQKQCLDFSAFKTSIGWLNILEHVMRFVTHGNWAYLENGHMPRTGKNHLQMAHFNRGW